MTETQCPLWFRRKHYLADSGGAGQWRGGASQVIEIAKPRGRPLRHLGRHLRPHHPPRGGARGRAPGCRGYAGRGSGVKLPDKGIHIIETGDSLVVPAPRCGGFGNPDKRDRAALEADIAAGLVTIEAARRDNGYDG